MSFRKRIFRRGLNNLIRGLLIDSLNTVNDFSPVASVSADGENGSLYNVQCTWYEFIMQCIHRTYTTIEDTCRTRQHRCIPNFHA